MNLPTKLTVLRIVLIPVFVALYFVKFPFNGIAAVAVFMIACFTDFLDGHLARKWNQVTTLGKFLDPIADKIVVIAAMIMLVEFGHLPAWIPIIVIFREFIVSGYRLVAVQKDGNVIAANVWGKLKTVTQMIAVILAFLDPNPYATIFNGNLSGYNFIINLLVTLIMSVSVVATIFSGWEYVKNGKELFKGSV